MKKNVLFIINTMTYFTGLLEMAKFLKDHDNYEPVIFFSCTYPTIQNDMNLCDSFGIKYASRNDIVSCKNSSSKISDGVSVKSTYRSFRDSILFDFFIYGLHILKESRILKNVFNKFRPALIVLGGDNINYNTSLCIKIGHQVGIASLVIPSWMAGPLEAAESVLNNPNNSMNNILNRIAGILFPKWVYEHKGIRLLRLPASRILIQEIFGIAPQLPWVLHSGRADIICAENRAMMDYMVREGIPADRIELTGSLNSDMLTIYIKESDKLSKIIRSELNLQTKNGIILSALPPDQLYDFGRPDCEFHTYKELIEFWVKSLATNGGNYNIVLSLHPSLKYEEFIYLEKYGVKISKRSITQLIPLCDIFVASISSTIQWAIACGKPAINYDVYKYRYSDYTNVEGVLYTDDSKEFGNLIRNLANDIDFRRMIQKLQIKYAPVWGILDGQSGYRILSVLNKSLNKNV